MTSNLRLRSTLFVVHAPGSHIVNPGPQSHESAWIAQAPKATSTVLLCPIGDILHNLVRQFFCYQTAFAALLKDALKSKVKYVLCIKDMVIFESQLTIKWNSKTVSKCTCLWVSFLSHYNVKYNVIFKDLMREIVKREKNSFPYLMTFYIPYRRHFVRYIDEKNTINLPK